MDDDHGWLYLLSWNNHVLIMNLRPGGMTLVQQLGIRIRELVRSPDPGRLAVPGGAAPYGSANWSGVVIKVIRAALMKYAWVSVRNTPPAG